MTFQRTSHFFDGGWKDIPPPAKQINILKTISKLLTELSTTSTVEREKSSVTESVTSLNFNPKKREIKLDL